jgi:hypothetical protein
VKGITASYPYNLIYLALFIGTLIALYVLYRRDKRLTEIKDERQKEDLVMLFTEANKPLRDAISTLILEIRQDRNERRNRTTHDNDQV